MLVRYYHIFSFFVLFLLILSACKKDEELLPPAYVDFQIYVNQAQFSDLHAIGNSMILKEEDVIGRNYAKHGVIVYRFSEDEFKAFDARCTYEPKEQHRLEITDDYVVARCTDCGSEFILVYGAPSKGPANMPLREYNTYFSGSILRVFN